uniref:hypothetical protein n=1 Tax=Prevotellamassilia timonensis TaxID=1852370 RepID=UPI004038F124
MTRIPVNYELFRRSMYVSKAWQAHSTFTPEEVAHVTKLNKRVAELTECSLEYAVAEALRARRRYQERKSAFLRRYIIKGTVSLGFGIQDMLKSCPEFGCLYPDEACKLHREGGKYCLNEMLMTRRHVTTVILHDYHFRKCEDQLRSEAADWGHTMLESDEDLNDDWKELRQQYHLPICWSFINLMKDFTMNEFMHITPDLFGMDVNHAY